MPHPPYSPNVTQVPFLFVCLFPWMKIALKGKHFADVAEVKQQIAEAPKNYQYQRVQNLF